MLNQELACKIVSIGAWGGYFESWDELDHLLNGGELPDTKNKSPKPAIIPPNERRRAPLPVKLAVETSYQATVKASIAPETLACVFVSSLGDTALTDYMCRVLASENKELSPTKFHNSVHNAAAGYWTISTKTMTAANSVAGHIYSVPLTLLEAIVQCASEQKPMLVTFYDAPVSDVLQPLLLNQEAFAFSLVLYPETSDTPGRRISASVIPDEQCAWSALTCQNAYFQYLYDTNPCGKILGLAEKLSAASTSEAHDGIHSSLRLPLNEYIALALNID